MKLDSNSQNKVILRISSSACDQKEQKNGKNGHHIKSRFLLGILPLKSAKIFIF